MSETDVSADQYSSKESMPEVCILGGPVPGRRGGIATFIEGLTEVVGSLGYRVWRGDGLWPPQRARYRTLDIVLRLPEKTYAAMRARRRGALVIENSAMWSSRARLLIAQHIAKLVHGGYVLVIHSGRFPDIVSGFSRRHRAAIVELSSQIERIVCVNKAMKEALVGIGVPSEAVSVMSPHIGSLDSLTKPEIPESLRHWLDCHSPVLVATGAMMDIYGFATIVGCAAELRKVLPQLGCLLFARTAWSDGKYEKKVYEKIQRLEMQEHCLVEYDVPYVRSVLEACDVMLRIVNDSAGICLYEAAYAGCDSVAYANPTRPAFTFTVPDGDSEALIAATQRCVELRHTDPSRRDELKQTMVSALAQNNQIIASLLLDICGRPGN